MSGMTAKRVTDIRLRMIQDARFWGALAMNLKPVPRDDLDTAATDGEHFFYNPAYVESLSDAELVWLWAHEAGHCALQHHARLGDRDLGEANIAADIALNRDLDAARIGKRPAGVWFEPQYDGLAFEEIYELRRAAKRKAQRDQAGQSGQPQAGQGAGAGAGQPQPGNSGQPSPQGAPAATPAPGNGQGAGTGEARPMPAPGTMGPGGIMKPGNGSATAASDSGDKWQIIARQAAAIAKAANAGTMPADAGRVIDAISQPGIDSVEILRDLINSRVSTDYSFSRPNRRFIGQGFYLPGIVSDGLDHVIFAVDTSGSIDQEMLARAAGVIIEALETGRIQRLTVIFADAKVCAVQEIELGDDNVKLAPRGGGGTAFAPTFEWIDANAPDATAVIYLTDMECSRWGVEPSMPVFWAVHGDSRKFARLAATAPFGEAVYVGRLA